MSRWHSAMESQPVSLTVMVGPTQTPSNHQARQWQGLSRVKSILGRIPLIESRAHTLLSISLYIVTPQCQSDGGLLAQISPGLRRNEGRR